MAGMIKNIFGLNTQDVADQRAELNRLKSAQRIKQGDIDPTVAILGQQFGDMLGRGLMKKLGYEDPEMAKAQENEALQKELQEDLAKLDKNSSDYYNRIGEAFLTNNDYQRGAAMLGIAQSIDAKNLKKEKEIEAKEKEDRGKPFVPSLATKAENDLYSSIIDDSDFSGINNEGELTTRIHNDLENYKDMWKKKQKKEGREDTWGGDKDAVLAILNQYKESGLIEKDSDLIDGINIPFTNKWEFKK
tara:strand:+ start:579 stop:1316 length:738 start_codon:yes stop_codon:yes gene_type:complete